MKKYPAGTVRRLLQTDLVTRATRTALETRLREDENYAAQFFSLKEFKLLKAVCRLLIPQNEIDCAAFIDLDLSRNKSNGWRYDKLPSMAETVKKGLAGINQTARAKHDADFDDLDESQQNEILSEIQTGNPSGEVWKTLPAELFFEELLAKTVEIYYAHPLAQEKIGYVGMADAPGWTKIKLNELEDREPRTLNTKS